MNVYALNSPRPSYKFLTAQSDAEAEEYIRDLDVRYVIINDWMPDFEFKSIVALAWQTTEWEPLQENSMVYRLYHDEETAHYRLVHREGTVKVFVRKDAG
jgi:hypothetical protein